MKRLCILGMSVLWILIITGCTDKSAKDGDSKTILNNGTTNPDSEIDLKEASASKVTTIRLGDDISVNGSGAVVDSHTVRIMAEGNYSVSGTAENTQIIVDADKSVVNLELAGVTIANSSGPAIYVADAKTTNLILKEGSNNNLTDGGGYADTELKAALFSEDSLTIEGNGTLNVTGNYKHGIASDDSLFIKGGNVNVIAAVADGLHANDDVIVDGGSLSIQASSDGIESELATTINGGELKIDVGDDAIHAETDLTVNGGTIHVTRSYEGLEGKGTITISDGEVRLACEDDSINAGVDLVIHGGYVYADCNGDGLDSNGNMTINGGTTIVYSGNNANGPMDTGDRNGTFTVNGGTIIATGGNMGISVSEDSKQYSMWIGSPMAQNTLVNISEQGGEEIGSFIIPKSSSLIFYSSGKLEANKVYQINTGGSHSGHETDGVYTDGSYTNGSALGSVTTSSKNVTYGQAGGGGGRGGRGGMGGWDDFGPGEGGRRPPQ